MFDMRTIIVLYSLAWHACSYDLYVSKEGSDDNKGDSPTNAFLTINHAKLLLRQKPNPDGATVRIGPGIYYESPLEFLEIDSGVSDSNRIIYRAEDATLSAGVNIPGAAFVRGTQQGVWQVDLFALGLTAEDLRSLSPTTGLNSCNNNKSDLFIQNQPMTLARWPNIDENDWIFTNVAHVEVPGPGTAIFSYNLSTRPLKWASEQDAWLHGYWQV